MEFKRNILITGGAGFIGSHVVRLFVNKYPEYRIINLDKLTYAGNLANLKDIENQPGISYRRYYTSGGGKSCGPFDKGSVYLCAYQRNGNSITSSGSKTVLGKPS